jgi:hypothetical protein
VDYRRHGSDETAAAALVVSSADADEEDRRAAGSLVIALLLAVLLAAAIGVTNANGATDLISTDSTSAGTGSSTGDAAPSGACRVSEEVAAALSTAETPWDYMRALGYPKHSIGDVLNHRAESVMDEHANGQVRWDPAANDGVYSADAQLVLIMGHDGQTVEITDTQQIMALLGIEAVCTAGTVEVLPAVS